MGWEFGHWAGFMAYFENSSGFQIRGSQSGVRGVGTKRQDSQGDSASSGRNLKTWKSAFPFLNKSLGTGDPWVWLPSGFLPVAVPKTGSPSSIGPRPPGRDPLGGPVPRSSPSTNQGAKGIHDGAASRIHGLGSLPTRLTPMTQAWFSMARAWSSTDQWVARRIGHWATTVKGLPAVHRGPEDFREPKVIADKRGDGESTPAERHNLIPGGIMLRFVAEAERWILEYRASRVPSGATATAWLVGFSGDVPTTPPMTAD